MREATFAQTTFVQSGLERESEEKERKRERERERESEKDGSIGNLS